MRRIVIYSLVFVIVLACTVFITTHAAADLSAKEARKLIARMAGIELPSDAVRVKQVSPGPLGSSAVVVAQIETAFRFVKADDGKWRVAEIRTGNNKWEDIEMIVRVVNEEKAERARAELETVATALEAFRRERGFYLPAESEAILMDHLTPRYLTRVIRMDPWHKPYLYEGTRDNFILRSAGADGKEETADDVVISNKQ